MRKLYSLIHGFSKSGKSWAQMTSPWPRLVLDAEGRTEYTPTKKLTWDGVSDPAGLDFTSAGTCVVRIKRWDQLGSVYNWLSSKKHPFKSMSLDSFTECQKQLITGVVGGEDRYPKIDEWGKVARQGEALLRAWRDMLREDDQPLQMVTVLAGTEETSDGRKIPFLQGSLAKAVSYPFDVVGYLYAAQVGQQSVPHLRIGPLEGFECGDGTDMLTQHYGPTIARPNLTEILSVLNPEAASA
jgi:hypothetical protein